MAREEKVMERTGRELSKGKKKKGARTHMALRTFTLSTVGDFQNFDQTCVQTYFKRSLSLLF